ncbi:MAG: hypothetical protein JW841_11750 [Deltaproteobacteria bacterium]|nr:hypothetical protein [Deltaproteobacteria bacterium]
MRTTIDMPDSLFERVRQAVAKRGITLRELVIDSLERSLAEKPPPFVLRDAAAGYLAESNQTVSNDTINKAIDEQRRGGY